MTFSLPDSWVWDFWTAVEGDTVHLFYLHAPKSLGDPELRHRNASIGHATSTDWIEWTDHGRVLEHGAAGEPDASATWTGSVFRDPNGGWRMFYTGSRFLSPDASANVETVLAAVSEDLYAWRKDPSTRLSAAAPWYETLPDGTWREEAWRDPWIVEDPAGDGWHMLITARARSLDPDLDPEDRGVIAHARSQDLLSWTIAPPLSAPGAGFAHLEVPQLAEVDGMEVLVFSCDSTHLAGARSGERGGIWALPVPTNGLFGATPLDLGAAHLMTGDELYAGRIVHTSDGAALLGFENVGEDGDFVGRLSDPLPLRWDHDGRLVASRQEYIR
ncbi:glycoside hydrolase family 68 protein [Amnibacterium flavum]|uniref:Glycosyl hydrolase family 32 n=1 Tax=Amnibacterium flavum TaxID=2173173 RepID=A0A2V1HNN7_9MICO|nr:glycoside hydrolase family 68 protein [Amnibacterium flavum]PVZ94168.1 glycosyl hydrolase family 32 [Amnibacterium flavum]